MLALRAPRRPQQDIDGSHLAISEPSRITPAFSALAQLHNQTYIALQHYAAPRLWAALWHHAVLYYSDEQAPYAHVTSRGTLRVHSSLV